MVEEERCRGREWMSEEQGWTGVRRDDETGCTRWGGSGSWTSVTGVGGPTVSRVDTEGPTVREPKRMRNSQRNDEEGV